MELGVFDSGYGGLTVLRAIGERLPDLSTIYLGDNGRAPYGLRDEETIFRFALEGVRRLFAEGCPLVVLACNTASAQALRRIQQEVMPLEFPDRRLIGVVRPLAEAAAEASANGHFGVIGTKATAAAKAYTREIKHLRPDAEVTEVPAPGLAGLIEEGRESSPEAEAEVAAALEGLRVADPEIDTILLACTHFPLAFPIFERHRPSGARYLMQDEIVADKLAEYLERHPEIASKLDRSGKRRFMTTGDPAAVSALATRFFGEPVEFEGISL